jgi:hypothetical protein
MTEKTGLRFCGCSCIPAAEKEEKAAPEKAENIAAENAAAEKVKKAERPFVSALASVL